MCPDVQTVMVSVPPQEAEPDLTKPDLTEPHLTEPHLTEPDLTEPDLTEALLPDTSTYILIPRPPYILNTLGIIMSCPRS